MRKSDLVRFKKVFIQQRDQILVNGSMLDAQLMARPDEDKDEVDQATTDIEQSMRMHLKNREKFTLKSIDEAIRRIEEGSYGLCRSCLEMIELRRLQARPTATLCIACKEEDEKTRATSVLGHRFERAH